MSNNNCCWNKLLQVYKVHTAANISVIHYWLYLISVNTVSTGVGILLYIQVHVFYAVSCVTSSADFPQGWEQPVCEELIAHKILMFAVKFMKLFLHCPYLAGTSKF
jgi:hypothetical protein